MSAIYKKIYFILVMLITVSPIVYSQPIQTKATDNVIGKKFTIASKVMSETRDIQIYFPQSYDTSGKNIPYYIF